MAAGITVPYNRQGLETQVLIHDSWPVRAGEACPKEYGTSTAAYGRGILCNKEQSYEPPTMPAGQSKRISAFYKKTGCLSHRTEEGFRDTRAPCVLTETPLQGYGTVRNSTLPEAYSIVMGPSSSSAVPPPTGSSARRSDRVSLDRRSERTPSEKSQQSRASSVPSWTKKQTGKQEPWNFDPLPMYEKTSERYGNEAKIQPSRDPRLRKPAGKSASGFLEPADLLATLTQ
eukprot:TRINITY_DN58317_c0_g1_i1.p1 TRINITY_DN58317_c0_g1~~TRINITY_DN58317_c0_g1_i1.p1  ORF type:complete len:230 (-),score=30.85 TRINITY_DN58317_c0_g1_i1:302-991(-)